MRPGSVVSFAPRPRRASSLRVRLLDGGGSHDPARARAVYDELLRRDPYVDAPATTPRVTLLARLESALCRHEYAAAVLLGIVVGLALAMGMAW